MSHKLKDRSGEQTKWIVKTKTGFLFQEMDKPSWKWLKTLEKMVNLITAVTNWEQLNKNDIFVAVSWININQIV